MKFQCIHFEIYSFYNNFSLDIIYNFLQQILFLFRPGKSFWSLTQKVLYKYYININIIIAQNLLT